MKHLPTSVLRSLISVFALCALLYAPCANASGMSSVHTLTTGSVSITNTQKNSSWVPVALLFKFDAPATGTITVERRTGSTAFLLTSCAVSNSQHAVWIPESAFPFNRNDELTITSTITNATVEIIRKADQ